MLKEDIEYELLAVQTALDALHQLDGVSFKGKRDEADVVSAALEARAAELELLLREIELEAKREG